MASRNTFLALAAALTLSVGAQAQAQTYSAETPAATCGRCHDDQLHEWQRGDGWFEPYELSDGTFSTATLHANAWRDGLFQEEYVAFQEMAMCRGCHLPTTALEPVMKRGVLAPLARSVTAPNASEGVTCASCHVGSDGRIYGPDSKSGNGGDEHQVVRSSMFESGELCASCHEAGIFGVFTHTYSEWQAGPMGGEESCNHCHMGGDEQHTWPGGHSPEFVAQALTIEVPARVTSGASLAVRFYNTGSGHNVPTGDTYRAFVARVSVTNASGQAVTQAEANIAAEMNTPMYTAQEHRTRIDPIPSLGSRPMDVGVLAPGTYTVDVDLTYQLNRAVTLIPTVGSPSEVAETPEMQIDHVRGTVLVCGAGGPC